MQNVVKLQTAEFSRLKQIVDDTTYKIHNATHHHTNKSATQTMDDTKSKVCYPIYDKRNQVVYSFN